MRDPDWNPPDDDPIDWEDLPMSRRRLSMGNRPADVEANARMKEAWYKHFVTPVKKTEEVKP